MVLYIVILTVEIKLIKLEPGNFIISLLTMNVFILTIIIYHVLLSFIKLIFSQ